MDLFQIITEIEKVDPEVYDRFDSRRRVFKHLTGMGKKLTAAAVPGFIGALFNKAYGQTAGPSVNDVLNLALQLEYLEYYFYDTGLKTTGLIPAADVPAIEKIRNDEGGHIRVLREALGTAAIPDPGRDAFDYSGGRGSKIGPFAAALLPTPAGTDLYFGVAQSFVDTGVRAYKGGAPFLMPNKDILETALNIHSVEARHSSHIRTIRRGRAAGVTGAGAATTAPNADLKKGPKSWISLDDQGGPSPDTTPSTRDVYGPGTNPPPAGVPTGITFPGEENVVQATRTITADSAISAAAASEAFDEPLDYVKVKAIARNFVDNRTQLFV
ncbi:ferritin-like domain-containing protein [Hymenobacter cellulosivorans]|uniref:Ferritin-like domain-containing protein n=1 Tax=Hymenobacter cellulosivorans TaxID=2932249 RepID=A0ABY4FCW0_9BACT|nr:ferritin-like domain-containing protein [Hymenobacter cellulosivorans]UOQ54504.1 ferritin-like domain-containing protein [Hymenobacter cellulosivorans]